MDVPNNVKWELTDSRSRGAPGGNAIRVIKKDFDSFQNHFKNFSPRTGKFLIPIKYRNCYFFSVS
jgi:hypothetical protein